MKEIQGLLDSVRESVKRQESILASLKLDELPEAIRAGIVELKDKLNAQLKALEPLDQIPAAGEAAYALNCLVEAMARMQEYASQVFTRLEEMSKGFAGVSRAYADLKAKVESGELVDKAVLDERCDLAREQGVQSAQAEILELRKRVLAGLPEAPESVLKLPAAEFAAAVDGARQNLHKAREVGLSLEGRGRRFLGRAIWLEPKTFQTELAGLQEDGLLGGNLEPLLAAGAAEGEKDSKPKLIGLV